MVRGIKESKAISGVGWWDCANVLEMEKFNVYNTILFVCYFTAASSSISFVR